MKTKEQTPSTDAVALADREVGPGTGTNEPVTWNATGDRERQGRAFRAWLPAPLPELPRLEWERLQGIVMGFLVEDVADGVDAGSIALAVGCAIDRVGWRRVQRFAYSLRALLVRLRADFGVRTLKDLRERACWDGIIKANPNSPNLFAQLSDYAAIAEGHLPAYLDGLDSAQRRLAQPLILPPYPRELLQTSGIRERVEGAAQRRRKASTEVVVPALPLLVELVVLRKQVLQRLMVEARGIRARVEAGEASLPVSFIFEDVVRDADRAARTLSEVRLVERRVALPFTLWDKRSWVAAHPDRYSHTTRWKAAVGRGDAGTSAYTDASALHFLEYRGDPADLLWFGELLAKRVVRDLRPSDNPALLAAAKALGEPTGFRVGRPGMLSPLNRDAQWLATAARSGELLVEHESLYRGVLYGAALATLSMTSGARLSEMLQVSARRWGKLEIPELRDGKRTGRVFPKPIQMVLTKGKTQEGSRVPLLISDNAFRLLREIQNLLTTTHGAPGASPAAAIPVVAPTGNTKAQHLVPEPYLFQWSASGDRRRGLLDRADVSMLIRFVTYGIEFTTRAGEPVRLSSHLLRHVVATYARHEADVPARAVAQMLHHQLPQGGHHAADPSRGVPAATEYYSREPIEDALSQLLAFQARLTAKQAAFVLQVPGPDDLAAMDAQLRAVFEQWGSIGPTPWGWCGAGMCVRPRGRGNCVGCNHVQPDFRRLPSLRLWRPIYERQVSIARDQGLAVQEREGVDILEWLDGLANVMRIQLEAHLDGGYVPITATLLTEEGHPDA